MVVIQHIQLNLTITSSRYGMSYILLPALDTTLPKIVKTKGKRVGVEFLDKVGKKRLFFVRFALLCCTIPHSVWASKQAIYSRVSTLFCFHVHPVSPLEAHSPPMFWAKEEHPGRLAVADVISYLPSARYIVYTVGEHPVH